MFYPGIRAAVAKERHNTMLAEAAAARLARQARQTRRHRRITGSPEARRVVLRDGSQVLIRQVQDAGAPLLAEGFGRLSAESRWMRFMTAKKEKKELSPAKLRYFTDLDQHDHEALGALNYGDGRGAGIAPLHPAPGGSARKGGRG